MILVVGWFPKENSASKELRSSQALSSFNHMNKVETRKEAEENKEFEDLLSQLDEVKSPRRRKSVDNRPPECGGW